ncbi:MAG: 2-methylcitrate dehydratase [Betaproteobacteria bacterium RIFCSPLOWO2_12_FULL_62_58]|nr:MAG: 2-methylcitrate dehydratase [Betaproteobacteria bacterium RIFCSPLOWO2_02_FULL_62_79]OGA46166.1 MAG: 2-methylcitrate dehydratase [Betaproteobacteria bacterium RIFCSPLOWO2_12_FULL_62_58]
MKLFERASNEDPMVTLCRMVVETGYEDIPQETLSFAKKQILDIIGVTMGGSKMDGIREVVELVKDQGGKQESYLPFYGGKVPASMAAFAIAPMSRAMDMGDTHYEAGHGAEYSLPALLAATGLKPQVNGRDFLLAFILAQELEIRVGLGYKFKSMQLPAGSNGGHYIFGAVAAVGKLLGFPLEELVNAQGIAKMMTQPHDSSMYNEGALMIRFHHGFVAQDAINACFLTRCGITGPINEILSGQRGYYALFAKAGGVDLDVITNRLGQHWEMTRTSMKAHSACKCTHTAIDGILEQMETHHFKAEDIERIQLEVGSVNWNVVTVPMAEKWQPQTVPQCQFSLPYVLATVVHDRGIFLDAYTTEARKRTDVRNFMTKISAELDEKLPPLGTRVITYLKNGKKISGEYTVEKGHPDNPLSVEDVKNKFRKCVPYAAVPLNSQVVETVIKNVLNLDRVEDVVREIILPLVPLQSVDG